MSHKLTRIATDGLSYLSIQNVEKFRIVVVPRAFKIGSKSLTSDHHTGVRELNRKLGKLVREAQLTEPELRLFLPLYQKVITEGRTIVSVHVARSFGGAAHEAIMAHKMLNPEAEVAVFESSLPAVATGFMVEYAARFATMQEASAEEVITLLRRLESAIRVFIITGSPGDLPGVGGRIVSKPVVDRVLGVKSLFSVEAGGHLSLLGQDRDIVRVLRQKKELFASIKRPTEFTIRCHRQNLWVKQVGNYLAAKGGDSFALRGIRKVGLEAFYLPPDGVEIVFLPSKEQLKNMADFAKRWGR